VRMFERTATSTRPDRGAKPAADGRCKRPRRHGLSVIRLLLAGLLGVVVAIVLVSCGASGKGLIPLADAGPLQSDFEAVAQAAQTADGNCTATTAAINKTEQDFAALPATIDPGLRNRLRRGISNLRERALALCAQPLAQTATTSTTPTPTQPTTTPTTTQTTSTQTTPTTPTPAPPGAGGGTPAPGSGGGESGPGAGQGGGTGVGGEAGGGEEQEGGK
jgi:hypothetical protein